jgi:hypothetical protein
MSKHDLGHQRENRILVAEEKILHEIENQPHVMLKLALQTMAGSSGNIFYVSFYAPHNYSLYFVLLRLCLSLCCFLNKLQALFYHNFS